MKRITSLLIAVVLAVTLMPVSALATTAFTLEAVAPFTDNNAITQSGAAVITRTLNPDAFTGGQTTIGSLLDEDMASLTVITDEVDKQAAFDSMYSAVFAIDDSDGTKLITLTLTPTPGAFAQKITDSIKVAHTDSASTTTTTSVVFAGEVPAKDTAISGFKNSDVTSFPKTNTGGVGTVNNTSVTITKGENFTFTIDLANKDFFNFVNASTTTVSAATVNEHFANAGVTKTGGPANITVTPSITGTSAKITVSGNPISSGILVITLSGTGSTNNLNGPKTAITATLSTSIVVNDPPAASVITGAATGRTPSVTKSVPAAMKPTDTFAVTIYPADFTWSGSTGSITVNDVKGYLKTTNSNTFDITYSTSGSNVVATFKPKSGFTGTVSNFKIWLQNPSNSGNKSKELAVSTTVSNGVTIANNKITGIASGAWLGNNVKLNGKTLSSGTEGLEFKAGDELIIDFNSDFFTWEKGQPLPAENLTSSLLSRGNITVGVSKKTNGNLIDSAEIVSSNGKAYIRVKFTGTFNSIEEKKLAATIYLKVGSNRHTGSQLEISGTMSNPVYEMYSGDDYVDMTAYPVIHARATIRNAELYIGNDMTVIANLSNNRKVSISSNSDLTKQDEDAYMKYNSIAQVLHIEQSGLITGSAKVSIDTADKYFVYDGNGQYLGTTDDKVAFANTYYLTTKRVSLNVGSGSTSSTSVVESSLPSTPPPAPPKPAPSTPSTPSSGGNVPNNNFNPPTGA